MNKEYYMFRDLLIEFAKGIGKKDAEEYVDNYVVFFDQLKYTSNSLSNIFDGYELKEVDFGDSSSGDEVSEAK